MEKIKIVFADDQQLFREGIAGIIRSSDAFDLIHETESGDKLLQWLREANELPHIALIDLNMPGLNGLELNTILHKEFPSIKVLVLSMFEHKRFIVTMITGGASGYLSKSCTADELRTALQTVYTSGFYFNQLTLKAIQSGTPPVKSLKNINQIAIALTAREEEILKLICQEHSTEAIANLLFLSVRTVDVHRKNLLAKIGCKNIAGLVVFAIKNDIYPIIF
jgi:DNA-binding NarL/FixJ family response regulator